MDKKQFMILAGVGAVSITVVLAMATTVKTVVREVLK